MRSQRVAFSSATALGAQLTKTMNEHNCFNSKAADKAIISQAYTACADKNNSKPCNTLLGAIDQELGHEKVGRDSSNLGSWDMFKNMDKNDLLYVETICGDSNYWKLSIREKSNSIPHTFNVTNECTS